MRSADNDGYLLPEAADQFWVDSFGVGRDEFEESTHAPFPKGYITLAQDIVRRSGVVDLLDKWIAEDKAGKRGGGYKPHISFEAALVVLVMHGIASGFAPSYKTMGTTLSRRIGPEAAAQLGIPFLPKESWYFKIYGPLRNVLKAIDPDYFPKYKPMRLGGTPVAERVNRRRRLTPVEYQEVLDNRDPERQAILHARADTFMNLLVQTSVKLAGKHVQNWKGNSALDATFVEVGGHTTYDSSGALKGLHGDPDAGRYSHARTDHDGSKTTKSDGWGYELEITTMLRNHPDEKPTFPLMVTAVNYHKPGKITQAAPDMFRRLAHSGYPAGLIAVDLAYSSLTEENFYAPLVELGHTFAFDYKKSVRNKPFSQLGLQASWEWLIQVDGQFYIAGMPETAITATWDHATGQITDEQLDERLEERERYRLTPKARMDPHGYQRFSVPDPNSYDELVDMKTGEIREKPTVKSITVPPEAGLKFRQKYPYKSKDQIRWYGMRSLVEHSNSFFKDGAHEALGDPRRRFGKGWAYQYLMATVAIVSSNIRKITDLYRRFERPRIGTSDNRDIPTAKRAYRRQNRLAVQAKTADGRTTRYPKRN